MNFNISYLICNYNKNVNINKTRCDWVNGLSDTWYKRFIFFKTGFGGEFRFYIPLINQLFLLKMRISIIKNFPCDIGDRRALHSLNYIKDMVVGLVPVFKREIDNIGEFRY